MENKWNKKNALRQILYVVLYFIGLLAVCMCGAIHPGLFVLYQVTAGILLTGLLVKGFYRIRAPGVALSFGAGILLAFLLIGDFTAWHAVPILAISVLTEVVGLIMGYDSWKSIVTRSTIMSFASFGYYGQIWLNRAYTYECAIEEMPTGYADTLMACSPVWTFPVVVILGVVASVLIANLTAKLFKLEKK